MLADLRSNTDRISFFAFGGSLCPSLTGVHAINREYRIDLASPRGRFGITRRIAQWIPGNSGKVQVAPDRMSFRQIATLFLYFHDERSGRPPHRLRP